jgi:hypothetical protein
MAKGYRLEKDPKTGEYFALYGKETLPQRRAIKAK